jgi:hypothetical protein
MRSTGPDCLCYGNAYPVRSTDVSEAGIPRSKCSSASRYHHLLKTFWAWRDKQLPNGTVIWDLPDGQTYVTTPGSALLFPGLCAPTGDLPQLVKPPDGSCHDRAAMMPTRRRTRAMRRTQRITAERNHNRDDRLARQPAITYSNVAMPRDSEELPPF